MSRLFTIRTLLNWLNAIVRLIESMTNWIFINTCIELGKVKEVHNLWIFIKTLGYAIIDLINIKMLRSIFYCTYLKTNTNQLSISF